MAVETNPPFAQSGYSNTQICANLFHGGRFLCGFYFVCEMVNITKLSSDTGVEHC